MKPLIRWTAIVAAGIAVSYLVSFHHPVISFKYQDRLERSGRLTVRQTAREAQLRAPTSAESRARFRICLAVEAFLLLAAYGWVRIHRRSQVLPEGGALVIDGEPIQGELMLPLLALEDRRTPSLIGELLDKSRDAES
jgi:hypothetical protein